MPTAAPQEFEVVAVSSNSIRLTWFPPPEEDQNGVIRSYHINVMELPTGNIWEVIDADNDLIEIVNSLHPFYTYNCTVAAFTIGLGPVSFAQVRTDPTGNRT